MTEVFNRPVGGASPPTTRRTVFKVSGAAIGLGTAELTLGRLSRPAATQPPQGTLPVVGPGGPPNGTPGTGGPPDGGGLGGQSEPLDEVVGFAALALHQHPQWRDRFGAGDDADLEPFVQEVRRFYPFFPFVGGRVLREFAWRGHLFTRGTWVLLDLYGINHDERIWGDPGVFRPERFRGWDGNAFTLIPQGGGDHHSGHRCAGEWPTIALLKRAVRLLSAEMQYDVPAQDLRIGLSRMPAVPARRFVIRNVQPVTYAEGSYK